MRTMSLRALHRSPPEETVQVTRGGRVIGTFVPAGQEPVRGAEEAALIERYVMENAYLTIPVRVEKEEA